ncbi:MAG: PsbP-related protein [Candidatus Azambacteria bacterium]|nr:PsbP-related protein [Candidatus Azambacteria bacterium]
MNTQDEKNNQNQTTWKKYFSGWNFLINGLIAILPASLVIGILRELGLRGALVTTGILFGFVYLAGLVREKIGGRKRKIEIPKTTESTVENKPATINNNENKSSKKKWIWGGIILIVLIVVIALASSSPSENEQDISLVKTDKSNDYSEQVGNLYRNTKYNFRIKFPESWEIKSGDGPNIIQKAVQGNNTISVGVREIPAEYSDETATIKDVMSLVEFKDSILEGVQEKFPGAKLLDYGETKLDNVSTYWVKYSAPYSVLDINVEGTNLQYQLLHKNIFYFITAGTLSREFSSSEPEFKKSIATFVIENY